MVGEKQGRTLEPLLTTPVTTTELLLAKVLASFLPSLVIEAVGLSVYPALVAAFGSPGVVTCSVRDGRSCSFRLIGPLASLAALQTTIAVSSRANDPRSAQQIAVLLVLPLVMMLVGQIAGAFVVTTPTLLLFATGAWRRSGWSSILLSVALFERETILTRWQ